MASAVLFSSRLDSFFDANITSRGVLATICDSLHKYNLFHYLELYFRKSIFPTYSKWKTIVKTKILTKEADNWFRFCSDQVCEWLKHFLRTFPLSVLVYC